MAAEKKQFFDLVKRLHIYYRDQLSSALISISKFEKSSKYFIRALREICPVSHDQDIPTLSLRDMEEKFIQYKQRQSPESDALTAPEVTSDITGSRLEMLTVATPRASRSRASMRPDEDSYTEHDAHCLNFTTFFKNIHNFRIFRQHVKVNIIGKLRKLPENVEETSMQSRTLGELEALLSAWTTLLDRNNNVAKLVHPTIKEKEGQLFETELEMAYYTGILSLFPKLIDIVNKIEFALTKYEMSAEAFR